MGVTSVIALTSRPAAWRLRIAASRPAPGPLTKISMVLRPCSIALRAAASAVTWAANGVLLREPLKPWPPADPQAMTLPWVSQRLTMVLLKVESTWACPTAMFLRSRRRVLTTFFFLATDSLRESVVPAVRADCQPGHLSLVPLFVGGTRGACPPCLLLLAPHADSPPRAAPGAGVGAGSLAAHREAAAMAQAAVGADLHQPLDVERDLAAQVALDAALELLGDDVAQPADLGVVEVLG